MISIEDQVLLIVWGILISGILALIPVAIIVSRIYPWAYPNARVRAMKARLVTSKQLAELADRTYNDIIIQLQQYYPTLGKNYASNLSFSHLDKTLRGHLITQLEKIRRISPEKKYITALLRKYDIHAIETVTRSLATNNPVTNDLLAQTRAFSNDFINKKEHTLEDLRNELKGTPYEAILQKHYKDIQNHKFKAFEQELDLYYFSQLRKASTSNAARGYTKRLIDAHNIALRHNNEQAMIPGGKIPQEDLNNTQQLTAILNKYGYTTEQTQPELIERDIHKHIKTYAQKTLKEEPLSESSMIGTIALLTITVRNTIILLKLKEHNTPVSNIREVLTQ